tara:strand:- start:1094 stop:1537 length:444 start_codon:yes stop_codon:yes gene_type:complete
MTVGYLLDLLIINEVRKKKLGETLEDNIKYDLKNQNGYLLREIGKYLLEIAEGNRPGTFAKHKSYDEDVNEPIEENIIEVIYKLYQRHLELWELEDVRRDKTKTDGSRLAAADKVSVVNKKRNDLVEQLDKNINDSLKTTKLWATPA